MKFYMSADEPQQQRSWVIDEAACELQPLDNKIHKIPMTQDVKGMKDDGLLNCRQSREDNLDDEATRRGGSFRALQFDNIAHEMASMI